MAPFTLRDATSDAFEGGVERESGERETHIESLLYH